MTEGIPWPVSHGAFILASGAIGWGTFVALKYFEVCRAQHSDHLLFRKLTPPHGLLSDLGPFS